MEPTWKKNWEETKENFCRWWTRQGLVIGQWGGTFTDRPHEEVKKPEMIEAGSEAFYADVDQRVHRNHYMLSRRSFPADLLPLPNTFIGPGSLAMHVGSTPLFTKDSVWFMPTMETGADPEHFPPLAFNPEDKWWKIQEETLIKSAALGKGKYMVGCPDLVENIDILVSLRDASNLFIDMVERPEWVIQKVDEINRRAVEISLAAARKSAMVVQYQWTRNSRVLQRAGVPPVGYRSC